MCFLYRRTSDVSFMLFCTINFMNSLSDPHCSLYPLGLLIGVLTVCIHKHTATSNNFCAEKGISLLQITSFMGHSRVGEGMRETVMKAVCVIRTP